MKLVVGQNTSLKGASNISVNFAWRSLKSDLNMEIHVFTLSEDGQVIKPAAMAHSRIHLPEHIDRDKTGRHFDIDLNAIVSDIKRLSFWVLLPEKTKYNLSFAKNLQVRAIEKGGQQLAAMDHEDLGAEQNCSMHILDVYRHKGEWKLAFKAAASRLTRKEVLDELGYSAENSAPPKLILDLERSDDKAQGASTSNKAHSQPQATATVADDVLVNGIEMAKGHNFSLTEQFPHCQQLRWKVDVVPTLEDLNLNVIAVNRLGKVRNIKDFLYKENRSLRGGGVHLHRDHVLIDLDKISQDIDKLEFVISRQGALKRFNSADFVECLVDSAVTEQAIAKFIVETANSSYNAIILFELYRSANSWRVRAVGQGYSDGVQKLGELYGFEAPKLARQASRDSVTREVSQTQAAVNNPAITQASHNIEIQSKEKADHYKQMLNKSYILMGLAGVFCIAGFSSLFFLALGLTCGVGGGVLYRNNSQALTKVEAEINERTVLKIIKQKAYYVSAFDVAVDHVMTVEEAQVILEDLCAKGVGKVQVNDEGAVFYDFNALKSSTASDDW